jgi:homoserine O-acetyltransferase
MLHTAHVLELDDDFPLVEGGRLPAVRLAYETFGRPGSPCVVVLGGLSANAHVTSTGEDPTRGWWETVVGNGLAVDTQERFVVCMDYLGGCAGSTGPASLDPASGAPYSLAFPTLTLEDLARAAMRVLDTLDITDVELLIGTSMGAMVAIPFMSGFPGTVRHHVSVSGCLRSSSAALALRGVQRDMIRRAFEGSDGATYDDELVKLARKISLLSYRPSTAWDARFGRRPSKAPEEWEHFEDSFEIQSYLEGHASKYVENFDPRSFVVLSEALDRFDALERPVHMPRAAPRHVLVLGADSDALYPPRQQVELADFFESQGASVDLQIIDSPHGHDSFLIDAELFGRQVRASAPEAV